MVNIGDDRAEIRIIDLANRLFDLAGVHPRLAIEAPPPGSPERRLPSLRRLRSLAPGLAHTDLDTGLRTMLTWYSDRSPNGLIAE